jgi:hypothetical protein
MEAYFPGKGLLAIFFFICFLIFIEFCSKKITQISSIINTTITHKYGENKNVDLIEWKIIANICLLLRF